MAASGSVLAEALSEFARYGSGANTAIAAALSTSHHQPAGRRLVRGSIVVMVRTLGREPRAGLTHLSDSACFIRRYRMRHAHLAARGTRDRVHRRRPGGFGGCAYRSFDALGLVLGLVAALSLFWIQSAPLPALVAVCAVLVGNAAAGYPVTFVQWTAWIALFGCFALYGDRRRRLAAALVALLAVAGYVVLDAGPTGVSDLSGIAMSFLIATIGGDAAQSRRTRGRSRSGRGWPGSCTMPWGMPST